MCDAILKAGERLDDLERCGLKIIQNPEKFCFGMDAVLLSGFAVVKECEIAIDLGTGTGILPILLSAKTRGQHFTGLEIQPESADMARRSVEYNKLSERIRIVEGDIKQAVSLFGASVFDVVTTNPPYMPYGHGLANPDMPKAIARHEIKCTLEDVVQASAKLLKPGGQRRKKRAVVRQGHNADDVHQQLYGRGVETYDRKNFLAERQMHSRHCALR